MKLTDLELDQLEEEIGFRPNRVYVDVVEGSTAPRQDVVNEISRSIQSILDGDCELIDCFLD